MSRDKQIEEMSKLICLSYNTDACKICEDSDLCSVQYEAQRLYNAGYRKTEDVADEIFADIQKSVIHRILNDEHYSLDSFTTDLDELREKYTEGKR
jgi:hypothetical protein